MMDVRASPFPAYTACPVVCILLHRKGSKVSLESVVAYLGLGSNLGNRQDNLASAMALLSQRLRMGAVSSIYDTEPVGETEQPRFLNMVCQVNTRLAPPELLTLAKAIESKLGRSGRTNAPRAIDIDILFYDEVVIETEGLVIPHPRLAERAFVLVPLAEIAPDLVHPVNGKTVKELLAGVDGTQGVTKWEN